jgi:hypothetical protein
LTFFALSIIQMFLTHNVWKAGSTFVMIKGQETLYSWSSESFSYLDNNLMEK